MSEKNLKRPRINASAVAGDSSATPVPIRLRHVGNAIKRRAEYARYRSAISSARSKARRERKREEKSLSEEERYEARAARMRKIPRTLENLRERDETSAVSDVDAVAGERAVDEFAEYFAAERTPKIVITSSYKPSDTGLALIGDLLHVFPHSVYYARKTFSVKDIVSVSCGKGFSDVLIINENAKRINALTHIKLPNGPTAIYRLSSVTLCRDIPGAGQPTAHKPEIILNNFTTALGQRLARMIQSLTDAEPQFRGRRVVTFHNLRDFIFVRHHRYVFSAPSETAMDRYRTDVAKGRNVQRPLPTARLQELGPRMTLKLQSLEKGTPFSAQESRELEWQYNTAMATGKRRFAL